MHQRRGEDQKAGRPESQKAGRLEAIGSEAIGANNDFRRSVDEAFKARDCT